jgi:hypothetical protein
MDSLKLRQAIRSKYAWPGGYPMYLVMSDGESLCMDCARKEYKLIAMANKQAFRDGWKPEAVDINYEDKELYCVHCNAQIESAYGEA